MAQFVRTARIGALLAGACLLVAGSAASASAAPLAADKEKKQEVPDQSGARPLRICVESHVITGSRIPRPRECKTRAEWIRTTGIDPLTDR
ncbi:hypothetical protein [Sphingomonas sp. R1]|uniref:hypothetical protein n=1 Tax=Sphingomonas sp. R1 TaxID=399176 RepID=UPI002224ECC4|nr:hypothetical protein [Sphingomonas sp. R1]UYY78598.1 hypothetical protein OIM94_06310 [Sphingomonas sp. R1]